VVAGAATPLPRFAQHIFTNVWAATGVNAWSGAFVYATPLQAQIDLVRYTPVSNINRAPVPTAPAITTAVATAGISQIAAHDPNVGDAHTYAVSTLPVHGTTSVNISGLATYISNTGFSGADSFAVTVMDNGTPQKSGAVTINVTVQDTTAPVITLTAANVSVVQGGVFTDPGYSALDNIDGTITGSVVISGGPVNTLAAVGTVFTLNYNVSDVAGNAAIQKTRTVTITPVPDTTAPVITGLGATPVTLVQGAIYHDDGATALDNIDGNVTANITTSNQVNTTIVGSYTVTYNVSDAAGNAAIAFVRTVNVIAVGGAANRGEAVQVPLTGNAAAVEISSVGEVISSFSSSAASGTPPAGITMPFGILSYTTTVPAGVLSHTVNLAFSASLPANIVLYKIDNGGNYSIIPKGSGVDQWIKLNATTIALTLSDGGLFDLGGRTPDGVIIDPVAVALPSAAVAPAASGGGCVINPSASFDPAMLLLLLFACVWRVKGGVMKRTS